MCLPGCSEQRARNRAPQLGAGGPFREREGNALSDKDLEPVVDDSVENGLSPGGCSAKLLQNHRASFLYQEPASCSRPVGHMPCIWSVFLGEVPWPQ